MSEHRSTEGENQRQAGILLPLFSLPSPWGIGSMGESAYRFVDFLQKAGQSVWQILPIGPTGMGDSPYQSFSSFAGNPYFIDLDELIREGLLNRQECVAADLAPDPCRVDYRRQYHSRLPLLKLAYQRSLERAFWDVWAFAEKHSPLSEYALFMALKDAHGGAPWWEWEHDLQHRLPSAIRRAQTDLRKEIGFHLFLQVLFYRQWEKLKAYAHGCGVEIMGDIPIYTASDSADVWANPTLFQLDGNLRPTHVAGCPPDGFSVDGQLWGNPLYDWDAHEREGFAWWIARLAHCGELYDRLRIDHFRGFASYYAIPYGQTTARGGHWEEGPGISLFQAVKTALPNLRIVAEDLGFITPAVQALLQDCGFPGMRVLQFAFDTRDEGDKNIHLPHTYGENCIAYTGTHDNQTLCGWLHSISPSEKQRVRAYLWDYYTPDDRLQEGLIALLHRSNASLTVIPMQDYLGLGDESRINIPSTVGENWTWRLSDAHLTCALADKIRQMTFCYGRGNFWKNHSLENILVNAKDEERRSLQDEIGEL